MTKCFYCKANKGSSIVTRGRFLGVILSMYLITLCKNTSEKLKKITPKNRPLVTIDGPFLALQ